MENFETMYFGKRELYTARDTPLIPKELFAADTEFDIRDVLKWTMPCNMCTQKDSGPRCYFLCCGFLACQDCVTHFYKFVHGYGVCPYCHCVFPEQWGLNDILASPPTVLETVELASRIKQSRLVLKRKGKLFYFINTNFCKHFNLISMSQG